MNPDIIFALEGNGDLTDKLCNSMNAERGVLEQRRFPDKETYLRVRSDVKEKNVIVVCTCNEPDCKIMPLLFLAKTLTKLGAKKITLVAPYLSYMRQDKVFNPGEALTSEIFAVLLSGYVHRIVTVDPHLHRRKSMEEIYSIKCTVLHAAPLISNYIKENIERRY